MTYKEYIDLGFKHTDWNDAVSLKETGYGGFFLSYKLNKKASIEVNWDELNKPKLYVLKRDNFTNYITQLTDKQVKELIK